jgi:4-hydroxybenzoate polyprenyltransferase
MKPTAADAVRVYAIDIAGPQIDYRRRRPGDLITMTTAARAPVLAATLLKLGRVSNLPTVWTNVLAGAVLSGGDWRTGKLGGMLVAMSLFYVGGMYLNDYFDRAVDARERPERPIPSGDIAASAVATIGFSLIGAGAIATAAMGASAAAMAALLAVSIVAYDWHHKGNPFAPVVMGTCRALVYAATATALAGGVTMFTAMAAVAVGAFVAGLTYAARQESLDKVGNLWPLLLLTAPLAVALAVFHEGFAAVAIYLALVACVAASVYLLAKRPSAGAVSRAVGLLIAGISLCDAAIMASTGAIEPALIAVAGFPLTLVAQKYVAGT